MSGLSDSDTARSRSNQAMCSVSLSHCCLLQFPSACPLHGTATDVPHFNTCQRSLPYMHALTSPRIFLHFSTLLQAFSLPPITPFPPPFPNMSSSSHIPLIAMWPPFFVVLNTRCISFPVCLPCLGYEKEEEREKTSGLRPT
ncbi:hypothetical protein SLE2022_282810 [Rubroshorea leprosula]